MKIKILLLIFICAYQLGQSQNLIQNNSFEFHLNSAFLNGPGNGYWTDYWDLEPTDGSPDYFNPICNYVNYRVPINITGNLQAKEGNAYVGIATWRYSDNNVAEYIATNVSLEEGATYEFKMNVSLAGSCGYKTNLGVNLIQNMTTVTGQRNYIVNNLNGNKEWESISTNSGEWLELSYTFVAGNSGSYSLIIGYFRQNNFAEPNGHSGTLAFGELAYYLIDDVSLVEILPPPLPPVPCCPYRACYTNTSSLPSLTLVTDYIKAGNAEGCFASSTGPVTVTSGQNVVFRAGSFIEIGNQEIVGGPYTNIAGMDIQQGATFDAYIDGCNSGNTSLVPPINVLSVPNLFIRGLPNPFYIVHVQNALNYTIELRDNEGVIVLQQTGTINSNKAIIMIPSNLPTASYVATLTFSNCNSSITLDPFWLQILQANAREVSDTITINENTIKDDTLRFFDEDAKIHIFPNPAHDYFTISVSKTIISSIQMSILDIAGRTVNTITFNGIAAHAQQNIDISKLAKGVYFVKINSDESEKIEKLIVR